MISLPKLKNPVLRGVLAVFVGGVIFAAGYGFGNGTIRFSNEGPVQQVAREGLPADLDYTSAEEVYDKLKKNFDGELNAETLLDGLKAGLARATGDPYTEYMNAEASQAFNDELDGTFTGIGAELSKEDDVLVVVAPIAGFPAEKAGLRARDIIASIDGESTFDLTLTEAVSKIRGPEDTQVTLGIIREGSNSELEIEITRAEINIPSLETEITDDNIGVMTLSRFGDDTTALMRQAAQEFKAAKVKGVILDMRNNPGGLLSAAIEVSSLWLQNQTVLEERSEGDKPKIFNSRGLALLNDVPTVVLINEGSASASEIVAGALRDNKAATVIGAQSFGKGSVQELVNLSGGGTLKVTIARWFTPAGKNIDKEGIEPDKTVERTAEDFEADRDPQLEAAFSELR